MKKLLLTLIGATLVLPAAAAFNVARSGNAAVAHATPTEKAQKFGSLKSISKVDLNAITRADDNGFDVITDAPEGKEVKMLGNSTTFYIDYGEVAMDESYGLAYESVWTDNGEVYLKNPVSMLDWDTYIKGTVTDEGIKFDFPQPIFHGIYEDGEFDFYVDVLEYTEIEDPDDPDEYIPTFVPAEDTRSILFTKNEDGSYTMDEDYMLGVTWNDLWQGYGEMMLSLSPFEATPVVAPERVKYDYSYILADELTGWDYTVMRPIGIGELDGVTYISGIAGGMPDAVITGTFDHEANTLTIPSNQFMGQFYNHYIFMMVGEGYSWYNEDWGEDFITAEITEDPMVLNYDPEENVFRPVIAEGKEYSLIIFNFGNISTCPCEYYAVDRIYSQGKITDFAPIAPEIIGVNEIDFIDPDYSYSFEFNIFGDNKEGQVLRDLNIYYNIFINGELCTFTAEEYPELLDEGYKEITDIPVFLNVGDDIFSSGNYHGIALKRQDIETIGVRALYIDGEERGESEIVTVDTAGDPVSVSSIDASGASKTEYFDLYGRKILGDSNSGVTIKRTVQGDGTIRTEKLIK